MDKIHPRSVGEKDMVIGERIRTHRLIHRLSQDELGSKIGVSFQQVQKYEKGTNRVSSIRLSEIAEALGTNIKTLVDGTDEDSKARSTPFSKFIASKEGVQLIEAMLKIKDPVVRRAITHLVESLYNS
ncbi:helix-turn-helix transcriptional regulator [Tardiphaga sp.]|uniref:helix-turn-helix domain-containing protein n=1 Tax=Tardiphaga sp. TaxID=1926292 RepID=UPI0026121CA3|nr:helix-turn-helix transcriptional regulator [Tardiphaga sp.]MDB5618382.1 transcriptional regulator [Tardiphaga sp.]